MSKIYIDDIWVPDLFKWFSDSIDNSGGDGTAIICCGNPDEVSSQFVNWWADTNGVDQNGDCNIQLHGQPHTIKYGPIRFRHPRDEYIKDGVRFINYHDSNENFIFCDHEIDLGFNDYSFIIIGDCQWGPNDVTKLTVKKISTKS